MLNNVILVGRTTAEPSVTVFESGAKGIYLDIAVIRPFKNENNDFETDFIPVSFWYSNAEKIEEYCGKGSIIGINGRLITRLVDKQGIKTKIVEVVCDRLHFINLVSRNREKE